MALPFRCVIHGSLRKHLHAMEEAFRIFSDAGIEVLAPSGYYDSSVQHVFVDYAVRVDRKRVVLNEEAQESVWIPARHALRELPLEPNARHTLELYVASSRG